MNCLIYRYNSIYEETVINSFKEYGLNCIEEKSYIPSISDKTRAEIIASQIIEHRDSKNPLLFVFSINFFPDISKICECLNTLYVCWSVDSPVLELFSNAIKSRFNRIFLFDKAQYLRLSPYNPENIFYLPLATDVKRWDNQINAITSSDREKYKSEISFVGSLYNEKNPFADVRLDDYSMGYIKGILEAQRNLYGAFILESSLTDEMANKIIKSEVVEPIAGFVEPIKKYMAATDYLASQLAVNERKYTLNKLAEHFDVSLYTQSNTDELVNVHNKGPAETFTVMPKVFNLSKINLNITLRSIISGIPLRVFDICGCGGFLMSNYQEELFELFEPGEDIEVFSSTEELIDKCEYYLSHDSEREKIAKNGYNKVNSVHTINMRVKEMLMKISS